VLDTLFFACQEALALGGGSSRESLAPLNLELAKPLLASVAAWIAAVAWTHPRAASSKSQTANADQARISAVNWYLASFGLVTLPSFAVVSNYQGHGLAFCSYLASLLLLVLVYPRAEAFPDEVPPPPPTWDGAIEVKRFACPHCGARTFAFTDKL